LTFELMELYFKYIHDQFHSLFHRPSFILDLHQGNAPPVIVYAMMALSARFSTNPFFDRMPPTTRGEHFAFKSNALLNLRDISVTTIQACVLLGAAAIVEGEAAAESVYYSAACRIANYLDLPNLPASNPLEREVNLRGESLPQLPCSHVADLPEVYWTLCMIDVWCSAGINLPREMTRRDGVPYPMDEATFLNMTASSSGVDFIPPQSREDSLLAQMIKLNGILLEVNDAIKQLNSAQGDTNFADTVQTLSLKLQSWEAALPPNLRDTPENLHLFASQGLGRIFVAIYLGYYHFGQLLFYPYLDDEQRQQRQDDHSPNNTPTAFQPRAEDYAGKCKWFAMSLSRIIATADATPGCDVRYNMVGHITVVASSVFIHTLLFGTDQGELDAARRQLEGNFKVLVALREYWPALEVCFARLRTFHSLCRRSMDTSFRMDRWMVRFLTEFARPVGEEEREDEGMDLGPGRVGDVVGV
jgi:hypothetical protein